MTDIPVNVGVSLIANYLPKSDRLIVSLTCEMTIEFFKMRNNEFEDFSEFDLREFHVHSTTIVVHVSLRLGSMHIRISNTEKEKTCATQPSNFAAVFVRPGNGSKKASQDILT